MEIPAKKMRGFKNVLSPIQSLLCPFQFIKKTYKKDLMGCCNRWNKFDNCRYSEKEDVCPLREYVSGNITNEEENIKDGNK